MNWKTDAEKQKGSVILPHLKYEHVGMAEQLCGNSGFGG